MTMKAALKKILKFQDRETLTEAYEVRAFRDEAEELKQPVLEPEIPGIPQGEPGALEAIRSTTRGHGEQRLVPDDCQFGDNDLCFVEA